jgi:hypothetical protein
MSAGRPQWDVHRQPQRRGPGWRGDAGREDRALSQSLRGPPFPAPRRVRQAGPGEQLVMPLEDGFARLLVHGLAEFYGAAGAGVAGAVCVGARSC